jgi:predicted nucleic acid-binding protein
VTTVVLDAAVVIKWFSAHEERHADAAKALRAAYEAGELVVFAPPLLCLEIINVAGRRWHWDEAALLDLAVSLDDLGFELADPDLVRVAYWTARSLTAYDAAYVAVAEAQGTQLVTDDDLILEIAGEVARSLADA